MAVFSSSGSNLYIFVGGVVIKNIKERQRMKMAGFCFYEYLHCKKINWNTCLIEVGSAKHTQ